VSEYQHKCTLYTLAVAPPTGDNVIPFRKYFTVLSAQYSTAIDLSCQEQFSERETDEPAKAYIVVVPNRSILYTLCPIKLHVWRVITPSWMDDLWWYLV